MTRRGNAVSIAINVHHYLQLEYTLKHLLARVGALCVGVPREILLYFSHSVIQRPRIFRRLKAFGFMDLDLNEMLLRFRRDDQGTKISKTTIDSKTMEIENKIEEAIARVRTTSFVCESFCNVEGLDNDLDKMNLSQDSNFSPPSLKARWVTLVVDGVKVA
jgi:hypothetical protein